jgi:hypothetical protein
MAADPRSTRRLTVTRRDFFRLWIADLARSWIDK